MPRLKYDGNVRDKRADYACLDLGKKHDEVKERALMKKKMAARRFAELLLEVERLNKV